MSFLTLLSIRQRRLRVIQESSTHPRQQGLDHLLIGFSEILPGGTMYTYVYGEYCHDYRHRAQYGRPRTSNTALAAGATLKPRPLPYLAARNRKGGGWRLQIDGAPPPQSSRRRTTPPPPLSLLVRLRDSSLAHPSCTADKRRVHRMRLCHNRQAPTAGSH